MENPWDLVLESTSLKSVIGLTLYATTGHLLSIGLRAPYIFMYVPAWQAWLLETCRASTDPYTPSGTDLYTIDLYILQGRLTATGSSASTYNLTSREAVPSCSSSKIQVSLCDCLSTRPTSVICREQLFQSQIRFVLIYTSLFSLPYIVDLLAVDHGHVINRRLHALQRQPP